MAALDRLDAAAEELAALSFDTLTPLQVLEVMQRLERLRRAQPAVEHRRYLRTGQPLPRHRGGRQELG